MDEWRLKLKQRWHFGIVAVVVGVSTALGCHQATIAAPIDTILLLTDPIDISTVGQYRLGEVPADGSVVTEQTVSQTNLTVPSLWWAQDQFGGKLLDFWVAYPEAGGSMRRVDLLVNQQVWLRYNYLDRYAFVTHMGTAASDFGYNTRIYNWQGDLLAAYVCEYEEPATALNLPPFDSSLLDLASDCSAFLDVFGLGIFTGPSIPGAPVPSPNGF